ncbi:hypothetical protein [Mixta intestinalis]|jgi:hypothetical protein|uniref:Uncharacterized protein n=1 Tax=Mixta intestinalis TaxID=1615494 RepID=A0A6P1PUY9_9GAMM|nr:hypothetical protein [Mixta intestinalis]QHM69817.1 hypothetical protein C7M51_00070 [Mixta intestinalis]
MRKYIFAFCFIALPVLAQTDTIETAQETIRSAMSEPAKVQFKLLRHIKNMRGEDYICGEVFSPRDHSTWRPFAYRSGKYMIDGSYKLPEDIKFFTQSGCGGKELETIGLTRKQASYMCGMSWEMITDVVVSGLTLEKAADNALAKVKSLDPRMPSSQKDQVKGILMDTLKEITSDKHVMDDIKQHPEASEDVFMTYCKVKMTELFPSN